MSGKCLTVGELVAKLSKMDPTKRVVFDTEAARFNVHVVPISAVYEEDSDGFDLVTLHSDIERTY